MKQDMILILDLGSEENPRLACEIRALGVYSEIHPHDITLRRSRPSPQREGDHPKRRPQPGGGRC